MPNLEWKFGKASAMRSAVTAGTALALSVVAVAPAQATWTSTTNISSTGWNGQDAPTVSVDRQGDALLVWAACDGAASGCYQQAQARIRTAGGSLGPIKTLSPLGPSALWPVADSDDDGDAAVVWESSGHIYGRRITGTGVVGNLKELSVHPNGIELASAPAVAVEPSGRALVVWSDYRGGPYYTAGRYFNKDGTLGPVITFGNGSPDVPAVGMSRTGQATVAWAQNYNTIYARRVTSTSVSAQKAISGTLSGVGGYGRVTIGVDRDGDATIGYRRWHDGENPRVWARIWSRTGTLSGGIAISPTTDNVSYYHATASDLDGDSVIVWSRRTSQTVSEVLGRRLDDTGTLGAITKLGVGDRPDVALDDDGDGIAVWHSPGPPYDATSVYSRRVSRTGVFATAVKHTSDGRVPQTDVSPTAARIPVIWQQKASTYQIRATFGP